MDRVGHRKIVRSPSLKRRTRPVPITERVSLEKVLGLTVTGNASLAVDHNTGTIAYPAGCVVVLFNGKKNRQTHICNTSKKTITALAFTTDGKHLVTGECGHQPAVRVWDIEEKTQVGEFHGHKFGISCVAFAPNMKYIVSIGSQHDMMVNVWNWKASCKLASNKVSSKVYGLDFSEDGSYFVTAGTRHVKFWYLEHTKVRVKETVPLHGRSGILGDQRNNTFADVACGRGVSAGRTYTITQSGLLCEFNEKRLLDKWVELRTTSANSVSAGGKNIFIGCNDGIIRVFDALTLNFIVTLPRPHRIGVDVAAGHDASHMVSYPNDAKFPDTLAAVVDNNNKKLTCVYNDHSLYIWDIKDIKKIGKVWSFLYHSQCIWGLEVYPEIPSEKHPVLPPGTFITCSSDDTIRVWNLDPHLNPDVGIRRNIYSHELLKIIYTDPEYNYFCNVDNNSGDKNDANYEGKNGVRSIKVSPDGQNLASGDRVGNIRMHDLNFMEELCLIEAHDGEVLSLEFSQGEKEDSPLYLSTASRDRLIHIFDVKNDFSLLNTLDDHSSSITAVRFVETDNQLQMLSCGADKTLLFRNVQTSSDNQELQLSLNHHLVGKTTLYDMDVDPTKKFVATACHDRNVRIYNIKTGKQRKCYKGSIGDDGTLIRVQLDPSGSYAATSCSDKNLCIIDFFTGDCVSTMYGHSEIAPGLKFTNDLKHLISVSGDGCIFVWKLHPEFTQQMRQRLASLGKITLDNTDAPTIRRGTFAVNPSGRSRAVDTNGNEEVCQMDEDDPGDEVDDEADENPDAEDEFDYGFNVGGLPTWAKKQFEPSPRSENPRRASVPFMSPSQSHSPIWSKGRKIFDDLPRITLTIPEEDELVLHEESEMLGTMSNLPAPRGRWAQRVDDGGIQMKSLLDDDNTVQLSLSAARDRRRFTVEPDTLSEQLAKAQIRRETMVIQGRNHQEMPIEDVGEEENVDDDDDDFFTIGATAEEISQRLDEDGNSNSIDTGGGITLRGNPRRNKFLSHAAPLEKTPSEEQEDEGEEDEPEVILYPTVNDEGENPEVSSDSFHVFALSPEELAARRRSNRSLSLASSQTEDSKDIAEKLLANVRAALPDRCVVFYISTDREDEGIEDDRLEDDAGMDGDDEDDGEAPSDESEAAETITIDEVNSDEEFVEDIPSAPSSNVTTPVDPDKLFIEDATAKEEFLRQNFENIGASPILPITSPASDSGTGELPQCRGRLPSHRLSLSSRFLSRAQTAHLRRIAQMAPRYLSHLEITPFRAIHAQTLAEGTCNEESSKEDAEARSAEPEEIPPAHEVTKSGPHSPPTRLNLKDEEPFRVNTSSQREPEESKPSSRITKKVSIDSKTGLNQGLQWQQPQMRKCWSQSDLSQPAQAPSTNQTARRGSRDSAALFVIHKVETGPPSSSRVRPRSRDRTAGSPSRSRSTQNLASQNKKPTGSQPVIKQALGRAGSTTSLTKSSSNTAINTSSSSPRRSQVKQRNRLSMPASILSANEDGASESDHSLADSTNLKSSKAEADALRTKRHLPVISGKRLEGKTAAGSAGEKQKENQDDDFSDTVSEDNMEKKFHTDRKLMPPPVTNIVSKSRKDAFLKKAFQAKRGYTSDFSISQAKEMILGKGSGEKHRDSAVEKRLSDTDSDSSKSESGKKMTFTEKLVPGTEVNVTISKPDSGQSEHIDIKDLGASPLELPVKDHSPNKDPNKGTRLAHSGPPFVSEGMPKHRNSEPNITSYGLHQNMQSDVFKINSETSRTEQNVTLSKALSTTSVVSTALSTRMVQIGGGTMSPPDSPRKDELKSSDILAKPPLSPKSPRKTEQLSKSSDSPRLKKRSETFSNTSTTKSHDSTLRMTHDSPMFRRKLELARPTSPRTKEFKDGFRPTSPRSKDAKSRFSDHGMSHNGDSSSVHGKTDWRQVAQKKHSSPGTSSDSSQHSTPHTSPSKSPHHTSPVKSSPRSGRISPRPSTMVHGDEDPAEMAEACSQAVSDLKKSMTTATTLYQKLSTNCKKIPRDQSQDMLSSLRDAFTEVRTMMVDTVPGEKLIREERKKMVDSMCQTIESLATDIGSQKFDERVMEALEPLLERYSEQLSDRVYSLVQSRVDEDVEEPERPEIETDI